MRVLIIENDPRVLRKMSAALKGEGYQVDCAPDGGAALRAIEANQPDLVLLEVPGRDGMAVLDHVRGTGLAPVILLSENTDVGEVARGLLDGAADVWIKPVSITLMIAKVNAILRRAAI